MESPSLRKFLDELRRTVEPRHHWFPFPDRIRLEEPHQLPADPLASLIHDRAAARLAQRAAVASSSVPTAGPASFPLCPGNLDM